MKTSIKTLVAVAALTALVAGPASAMIPNADSNPDLSALIGADMKKIAIAQKGVSAFDQYSGEISDHNAAALQAVLDNAGVERLIKNRSIN